MTTARPKVSKDQALRARRLIVIGALFISLLLGGATNPALAAGLPGPHGPVQPSGSAAGRGHAVDASATHLGGGNGFAPVGVKGALDPYTHRLRQVQPHATGPDRSGPFDPNTAVRQPGMATERSDMFQDSAGRLQRRVSASRVNFKDAKGNWDPIDPTWTATNGRYAQKANDLGIDVAAAADDPALSRFTVDAAHSIGEQLVGAAHSTATVSGREAVYPDALPGIDVDLTAGESGVEEVFSLKSASAPTTWSYLLALNGLTATVNPTGGIDYTDSTGKVLAQSRHGFMTDSAVTAAGGGAFSDAVTYALSNVGGKQQLTVTLDPKWVADPARVFPIKVDPPYANNPGFTSWVDTASPNTDHSGQHSMAIGTYNASNPDLARSFLDFSGYGGAPSGRRANDATFTVYLMYAPNCSNHAVELHTTNTSTAWNSSNVLTYPGPSISSTVLATATPTLAPTGDTVCTNSGLDTTRAHALNFYLPQSAVTTFDTPNNGGDIGLCLKALDSLNTTTTSWYRFDTMWDGSTYAPKLTIDYTENSPPEVDTEAIGSTTTLTPEFLATGHDTDVGGPWPWAAINFDFQVYATDPITGLRTGNPVVDSGLQASGDFVVPPGKLNWASNYVWIARAYDGASYSDDITTDPGIPFSTAVPQPVIGSTLTTDAGHKGFDNNTGNLTSFATDASVAGIGPALTVRRTYNSKDSAVSGAFGAGWTSLVDTVATAVGGTTVTGVVLTMPDGRRLGFGANGTGGGFTAPQGTYARLTVPTSGGGYVLADRNGTVWNYTHAYSTRPATYGLNSVVDAQGRTQTYTWTGDTVTKVTGASGRSLYLAWKTPSGASWPHVATVSTDPGTPGDATTVETWNYGYTGDQLSTACQPGTPAACATYGWTSGSHYPTTVLETAPHYYYRLSDPAGSTQAVDSVNESQYTTVYVGKVTLGSTPSPVANSGSTAATFDGSTGYVLLPQGDMVPYLGNLSISVWFKTSTADRVLVGYHDDSVATSGTGPPPTTTGSYIPALYVGSDGKLHGQLGWSYSGVNPTASTVTVTDGKWHRAVLSSVVTGTSHGGLPVATETLYLDGAASGTPTVQSGVVAHPSYVTVGAGFNGGSWPNQSHTSTATATYFAGSISDFATYARALTAAEIAADWSAAAAVPASLLSSETTAGGVSAQQVTFDVPPGVPNDSVHVLTDSDGGKWTRSAPSVTGSSAGFAASVEAIPPPPTPPATGPSGPTVYWRMGETWATQAFDTMHPGSNFAHYDNVTLGQTGPFGVGDSTAVAFDGTKSDMTGPSGLDLADNVSNLSISMWFQTSTTGGVLFGYANAPLTGTATSYVPALYVGSDGLLYGEIWNGGGHPLASVNPVTDGKWHYAVLSAGSGGQMLYLDGQAVSGNPAPAPTNVTGDAVDTVGAGWISNYWPAAAGGTAVARFKGNIAEFAAYPTALTAQQVAGQWVTYTTDSTSWPVMNVPLADPTNKQITDSYDPANSLRAERHTDTLGRTSTIGYDIAGFADVVTDADGHTVTTTHDALGNQLTRQSCQDQANNKCSIEYWTYPTPNGTVTDLRPTAYYDARTTPPASKGQTPTDVRYLTSTIYNGAGDPTKVTGPPVPGYAGGRATQTTYTTSSTAAFGGGTTPPGLVAQVQTQSGAITAYAYYADGDLATVTDPRGKITTFTYDGLGRMLSRKISGQAPYFPDLTTTWTYDLLDRVATRTDPAVTDAVTGVGHTAQTTFTYDPDSHVRQTDVADLTGGDMTRTTKAGFDSTTGRQTSWTDATNFTYTYSYDQYGNRTGETDPDSRHFTSAYDTEHQLLTVTLNGYNGDPTHPAGNLVLQSDAYDPAGRLASRTDAMGRTDTITYFDNGLLATRTRSDGNGNLFTLESDTYDNAGNLTGQVTDNGATTTNLMVDAAGRVYSSTLDPTSVNPHGLNRTTNVAFDAEDHPTNTSVTDGTTTVSTDTLYDALGGLLSRTLHDTDGNRTTTWTRDQRGLVVSMTDPLGNATDPVTAGHATSYVNDEAGHRVQVIEPGVNTETGVEGAAATNVSANPRVGYDTFGEAVSAQDADGNRTITGYDADGHLTSITSPSYQPPGGGAALQPLRLFGYDNMGRLHDYQDAAGNHTIHLYNQLGSPLTTTAPGSAISSYVYDPDGEMLSATDPMSGVREATWDFLGRPATSTVDERTPSVALTTTWKYGTSAWPTSITTPAGVVTGYAYNAAGERTTVTDGVSNAIGYGHDLLGRTSKITLPDKTARTFTYDYDGNLTAVTDLGHTGTTLRTATAGYDLADRRTSMVDGNGNTTTWGWDADGGLVSQIEPVASGQSITTSFAHDPVGNPTRFTDGRGNNFLTTYNKWNLRETRTEPSTPANPNTGDRTWTTGYDVMGRVAGINAPGGVSRARTYDVRGNLQSETGTGAEAATVARNYTWDLDDRLSHASTPSGTDDVFTWNDRRELATTSGPSGAATFGYNPDGHMATRTDAAGTTNYTWDADGRLWSVTDAASGTTATRGYDIDSQLTSISYGNGGATRTFGFTDDLHRINSDTLKNPAGAVEASISYGYDNNDNLKTKTTTGTAGAASNTYTYDLANRLLTWNNGTATTNYGYDASGNRTSIGPRAQSFDARNRITNATDNNGSTAWTWTARGTIATVTGATNRTVTSDAFDQAITDGSGVNATTYTYDALARQLTAAPGTGGSGPTNNLSYSGLGNDIAADSTTTWTHDPAGKLLAGKANGTGSLALTDQHQDATAAFTATGTGLTASAAYDPLGRNIGSNGTVAGSRGYQSGWTDPATGQVDMWHRRHDPTSGLFDSRDHLDLPGAPVSADADHYTYADDNPLAGTDPTGYVVECLVEPDAPECTAIEQGGISAGKAIGQGLIDLGGAALGGLFGDSSPAPSHNIFAGGDTQTPVTGGFTIESPPEPGCLAITCGGSSLLDLGNHTSTPTRPSAAQIAYEKKLAAERAAIAAADAKAKTADDAARVVAQGIQQLVHRYGHIGHLATLKFATATAIANQALTDKSQASGQPAIEAPVPTSGAEEPGGPEPTTSAGSGAGRGGGGNGIKTGFGDPGDPGQGDFEEEESGATPGEIDVFHMTSTAGAAQSVVEGIDPAFLNDASRFGPAFYAAEEPETALAEVGSHGTSAGFGIRFSLDLSRANVLDLADPDVAAQYGYSGGPITNATQEIGAKASEAGFNAIRFGSERAAGANYAILGDFDQLLFPQMITPLP